MSCGRRLWSCRWSLSRLRLELALVGLALVWLALVWLRRITLLELGRHGVERRLLRLRLRLRALQHHSLRQSGLLAHWRRLGRMRVAVLLVLD